MLKYPDFNPIALSLGPLKIHWYGVMYLLGFLAVWGLARYRMKTQAWAPLKNPDQLLDLIYWGAFGVILGGRLGYMLFYDFPGFIHAPWTIVEVWDGGMSFHGGLLGVACATLLFARRHALSFLALADFVAPFAPIGLALGRLGNFINGELWGRITDSPVGMIFPSGGPWPRYPSQLFECALEGIVLFGILWLISLKKRRAGLLSALFLIGYALARFSVEFFREPDPQLGYLAWGWLTMGQALCLPMFLAGIYLLWRASRAPA
jgi:phosphatidylglycerol:prolipoprotein diacylglycerol transferase